MILARRRYLLCLLAAVALVLAAVTVSQDRYDDLPEMGLVRLVAIAATVGATAATWGMAVMIASIYRVVWPLVSSTIAIVLGLASVGMFWHLAHARGW